MSRLARLSARERALVLLVLPLAILLAGWRLGWVPLAEARAARTSEIAALRLITESAARAGTTPLPEAGVAREPFAARVTASAEAAGLALSRLEPEGERLRVTLGDSPFAQVVLWLSDLEAEQGVILAAVDLDRRPAPGLVSARILLEDSP